ncbi:hypothetical protein BKA93DRAFT_734813 [Sparassis latifolia]
MAAPPDYDDSQGVPRPYKRPRHDSAADDALHPYSFPTASSPLHPETDPASEAAAKKNRKKPLSCGECRRYCDRVFPCQSCCKRGCAEICPEGSLTGGKGSRFILANTEQLHEKIKAMSERIRNLEDALQSMHAQYSPEVHPLLRPELLLIKRSPELFGIDRSGMPTTSASDNHTGDEDEQPAAGSSSAPTEICPYTYPMPAMPLRNDIPEDIARLSHAFPVSPSTDSEFDPSLRQRLREMLPPPMEAQRICSQAQQNAFWHYSPDASESFMPNLLHSVYNAPLQALLPHRLSLFLMILAIGTMVDLKEDQDRARHDAERYHQLARAAMCETMVIDDPSFDAINSLFFMVWYLLMFSYHKKSIEHAWGIMGLLAKLAQGVNRDGVRLKMIPEELDRRKTLLWNMMSVDVRLALMLRRPPSICIQHVDAKRPMYSLENDSPSTSITASCMFSDNAWRDIFTVQCMAPVLESVIATQPPPYIDILQLDWKIRDFVIPPILRMVDDDGFIPNHPAGLQQALTFSARETALLNLHRCYFLQALNAEEGFTMKHKYAPSVLATYTSVCNVVWTVCTCYKWEPDLSLRITMLWHNCLSAAVALCVLVSRSPSNSLTPHALVELDNIMKLFSEVKSRCPTVVKATPLLDTIIPRSRIAYMNWRNGLQGAGCFEDEICVIARRTGILANTGAGNELMFLDGDASPFEHAHPLLRRCFEQSTKEGLSALDPLLPPHNSLGPLQTTSTSQTFSTSAERTVHEHVAPVGMHRNDSPSSQAACNAGWIGAEFQDSSWMTWY